MGTFSQGGRKKISTYAPTVTGGGGGGGATPTISWGPDFGEVNGVDGVSFRSPSTITMPNVATDYASGQPLKGVGTVTMPVLSTDYSSQPFNPRPTLTIPTMAANYSATGGQLKGLAKLTGVATGAPVWQSVQTNGLTASNTQITVNKPASVAVGDLLIAFIATQTVLAARSVNTPTGWTAIDNNANGNTVIHGFRRIADGTEGSTFTFTFSGSADQATAEVHRLTGTDPTTPININASGNASVVSPITPSVTTTVQNTLVFYAVTHNHAATTQSHTPPGSNTETTDFESTNINRLGSTSGYQIFNASGATGTATVTCTELLASNAAYLRVAIAPGSFTLA